MAIKQNAWSQTFLRIHIDQSPVKVNGKTFEDINVD